MGKMVEKTRKKKKGRPSLLDLQKRTLKQEQEQQQQQQQQLNHHHNNRNLSALQSHNNYASATDAHLRRSTRRNPNPSLDKDDDEDESSGERRQKELKLVLKLPSEQKPPASCPNSHSSDWHPDDSSDTSTQKKRKINAIGCGSGAVNGEKGEKSGSGTKFTTDNSQETQLDSRSSTPLPDKKLLLFILDRLQKKDTYGVFSEPVDPGELPDYHEVIEHPMDFGTVRKKLAGGAYANLEQFENDVFLIASNAMQYNAPDTIYFRQARSIRELAQKDFENLRQDSDDNDPEPKVVRRGRPPTKSLKKPVGRPPLDRTGSEFSSDATLATGAESTTWPKHDMRKGHIASNKFGLSEPSANSYFPRNDVYASWLAESKFDRSDEGSSLKGTVKFGKRYFVIDENRRNTYNQFHPSAATRELSVLSTFDGERRQLTPVGVYTEHGYARSLARYAANLGTIAWKIASGRIQMCVPSGTNFGQGWVGENDLPSKRSPLPILQSDELPRFWPAPAPQNLHPAARSCSSELKKDESHGRLTPSISSSDVSLSKPKDSFVPTSASAFAVNRSSEVNTKDNSKGTVKPRPSSQIHQTPKAHPVINGFNSGYGFKVPRQMGKPVGATRPAGFDSQSSQMLQTAYMTSNNTVPVSRTWDSNNLSFSENSNSASPLAGPRGDPVPASWQQAQPHDENAGSKTSVAQNLESALPDLNVRFQQSRGSPSSSRVDSSQSDLVLHNELQ